MDGRTEALRGGHQSRSDRPWWLYP